MKGALRFLRKEGLETVRTWRIWVVPGLLLFFAITSPILALMTPALLDSVAQGQSGVQIIIPDPTYLDAYAQWLKNLQQIVTFALLLTAGGMVAGERASGTAILVLTKPVSRAAFVLTKFLANVLLLVTFTIVGAAACLGVTYLTFGEAPVARLATSTAAWLGFAVVLLALMTLFSSGLKSLSAGGAGLGAFFALTVLSLWGPALKYSPAGVYAAAGKLLTGEDVLLGWPVLTSVALVVVALAGAVAWFRRQEL